MSGGKRRGAAHLDDDRGRDAMAEELVELRAHLHHTRGGLLLDDHVRDLVTVRFPIRLRDAQRARGQVGAVCVVGGTREGERSTRSVCRKAGGQ